MKIINNSLVRGALAGAIATVPMTFAMGQALDRREGEQPFPPEEITENLAAKSGYELTQRERRSASWFAHFAYGALCGAIYSVGVNRVRARPVIKGPLFALAVWAGSYMGWLPALRLMPSAKREPAGQNAGMIFAHLVWGLSVARLVNKDAREMMRETVAGIKGSTGPARLVQQVFA